MYPHSSDKIGILTGSTQIIIKIQGFVNPLLPWDSGLIKEQFSFVKAKIGEFFSFV